MRLILVLCFFSGLVFVSCQNSAEDRKKVVYINSYHDGHPSSDEIMEAVLERFPSDSFHIKSYYMDTKRNPSTDYIQDKSVALLDSILIFQPDVLIVSDDNAVKYIVEPHLDQLGMPIVFCGVNGSDDEYNLPYDQVTGMIEILPVEETILALQSYYPEMNDLLVLTENTTTSRKEKVMLDTLISNLGLKVSHRLVDDFEEWKIAFRESNGKNDVIYIVTNGAIKRWESGDAVRFIKEHIQVPVFTCEDFMMPFAVFGMTKVAREQGAWAAEKAKDILEGTSPADIPVTRNMQKKTWLNHSLARKIGFAPDTASFDAITVIR
jgi:ABC-type uncharacterized transport system substrate-binding protein